MVFPVIISTDTWLPVILLDDTDGKTAETGKAYGGVTCKYYKCDGSSSLATYSVGSGDWHEKGEGGYAVKIGASEFDSAGFWEVTLAASGCRTHRIPVYVTASALALTGADGDTLKSLSDEIATADAVADAIKAKTDNLPASPAAVGSAMTLADDAITAAKFDESTAFPVAQADTGASALARANSAVDTGFTLLTSLKRLLSRLDGVTVRTPGGPPYIIAYKNKAAATETTHTTDADGNRTVS